MLCADRACGLCKRYNRKRKSAKLRHLQIIVVGYKIGIEINLSEENNMSEQYELNKNLAQMLKGGFSP